MQYRFLYNKEAQALYRQWADTIQEDRSFLMGAISTFRVFDFNEEPAEHIVTGYGDKVLSLVTFHVRRRKRGVWGRYLNVYYAYTIPEYRRLGLASFLMRSAEEIALVREAHRIKSLAGSLRGFYLHKSLGHNMWGFTKDGSVVVDHFIDPDYNLPGVPPNAKGYAPDATEPLSYAEVETCFREAKADKPWALLE